MRLQLAIIEVSVVHYAGFRLLLLTKQQYFRDDVKLASSLTLQAAFFML
jgi:hypothetical protein